MPVIHVFHRVPCEGAHDMLRAMCTEVARAADLPLSKVWGLWHRSEAMAAFRADWEERDDAGPIVRVFCRRSHTAERVQAIMHSVRRSLASSLGAPPAGVFVQVVRVDDEEVLHVW